MPWKAEDIPAEQQWGVGVHIVLPDSSDGAAYEATHPLYPHLGLAGGAGTSASDPKLQAALQNLFGGALAPLVTLEDRVMRLQPFYPDKGGGDLELELHEEKGDAGGKPVVHLRLTAHNKGKNPIYLGPAYCLHYILADGRQVQDFQIPKPGYPVTVDPGKTPDLIVWCFRRRPGPPAATPSGSTTWPPRTGALTSSPCRTS